MAIDFTQVSLTAHAPCPDCVSGRVSVGTPGTMPTAAICPRCAGTGVLNFAVSLSDLPGLLAEAQRQDIPVSQPEATATQE